MTALHRTFSVSDQLDFARISGDHNPLHVDAVAARRLLFGGPVVHGVHALLWCLDELMPAEEGEKLELLEVKAIFSKPISVGESVRLEPVPVASRNDGLCRIKARLLVNNTSVTTVSAVFQQRSTPGQGWPPPLPYLPDREDPREILDGQLEEQAGELPLFLEPRYALALFPRLVSCLPSQQLASLLAATRIVGVHCPGLHSLFSELNLRSSYQTGGNNTIGYKVTRFDKRFSLVTMAVTTPSLAGELHAFRRPGQYQQPLYSSFLDKVNEGEFGNCRALVIGGSRGLGEVAAKLLCAGGADVRLTFFRGARDAEVLVEDIGAGGGKATALPYNVCEDIPESLVEGNWVPTHVLYFATPAIQPSTSGAFSITLFRSFCDYYVYGFTRIFASYLPLGTRHFFLPSSSLVDELSQNFGEYIAAKQAAEAAARILEKAHRGVLIEQPRLPRLATDQTVALGESEEGDPVPVILQALRRLSRNGTLP